MTSAVEVSCFYIHYNREPINFTFIKYEKFMKITVQGKNMSIEIENLKYYSILYYMYILSLLCTKNTSEISVIDNSDSEIENYDDDSVKNDKIQYGILTQKFWKCLYFRENYSVIQLEHKSFKNPLLSKEPTRETSVKKQLKIIKRINSLVDRRLLPYSLPIIDKYLSDKIEETGISEIVDYENKIYLLCCIRHFNKDIYHTVMKFMRS